jgi:hypothetical protein
MGFDAGIAIDTQQARLARNSSTTMQLPRSWSFARVSIAFDDGFDRFDTEVIVDRKSPAVVLPNVQVVAAGTTLRITTK